MFIEVLSSQDIKDLLSAIADLNAAADPATLPGRVMRAVEQLVGSDLVVFDSFAETDPLIPEQWHNNDELLTPRFAEICLEVYNENPYANPLVCRLVHGQFTGALRLSDTGGVSQFLRTSYYNEVLRPLEVRHQMGVTFPVDKDILVSCAVNRKTNDFTERERTLLSLLAPHLTNALQTALAVRRLEKDAVRMETLLDVVSGGVVILGQRSRIDKITGSASRLIETYFGQTTKGRLPEPLSGWITTAAELSTATPTPLVIERDGATLTVRLGQTPFGESTILFEEKRQMSPAGLTSLGITARESEILYWISQGKADQDIATLCSISRRTVQKHTQHILSKLGVETRTAAARTAMDKLAEYA